MKSKASYLCKHCTEIIKIVKSPSNYRSLIHIPLYTNAIYLIVANVLNAFIGFVFWIIVARFYSTEEVGLASAIIATMTFVVSLSLLGLDIGLMRFLNQSGRKYITIINTVFTLGMIVAIVVAFIYLAGIDLWSPKLSFLGKHPVYITAFVIITLATNASVFLENTFIASRRSGFATARALIFSILRIPLPVILANYFGFFGIVGSWGIAVIISLLIGVLFFLPKVQKGYRFYFTINKPVVREIFHYSFVNFIATFLWNAPGLIFPIMVVNMLGAAANAYFYIGWAIGNILAIISVSVSMSLFAEGSYDENTLGLNLKRSLKMVFIIEIPAVILVLLLADKILLLFGTEYSNNAVNIVRMLALTAIPLSINNIYIGLKRVQKDLKSTIIMTTTVTVITLVLAVILLPVMGIDGAVLAFLTSNSGACIMILAGYFLKRHQNKSIPF